MVCTSGLMRSNGSVSHAVNTSTDSDESDGSGDASLANTARSWAIWEAATAVGVTISTGRLDPSRIRPANTNACAGVETANVAPRTPTTWVIAGSLRSSAGSERRFTRSGYR